MFAMFVGIITLPLIIAGAAGLNVADSAFFVNMALIISGISSYIPCRKIDPVGSGLLGGTIIVLFGMVVTSSM
ncbi:MAG: hypothetical protein KGY44_06700 [Halanaerobiales bacterium]|nr:hypothetical protein [Halanaerobiales bacterium]